MNTTIYFVRHAHSTYTPDELGRPLSEQGLADAHKITACLEYENIDCVIASPYKRAIQTVEGVAFAHQKEIQLVDAFRERLLSSRPLVNFSDAVQKVWRDPSFSWEGGESNDEAQKRAVEQLTKLLHTHEGQTIVIGTHGNIMMLMMNYYDAAYGYECWSQLRMPDLYKLTFSRQNLVTIQRVSTH
ncbi:histidine phosphatase family protein [Priestia koreensis]|uniref:Phosphoglycerate mutase n=1 Tax=Priestia koreensis TaxID=284581 RepID=A0A0M0L5S3_9BACI|nr:histidine phosphatase family protein [Priestia koreensis]KOO46222.1 phosphoglycerate mutase [Priestia koreensis]